MRTGYEITDEDFRRLYPKLYQQIRRLGIRHDDIEDLVSEALLHAQEGLDEGRFDRKSELDTWIVGIAKKRALKFIRRFSAVKRSGVEIPIDHGAEEEDAVPVQLAAPEAGPDRVAEGRRALRHLKRALRQLPDKFRQPLTLNVHGLSYHQIATVLGISPGLVTSRVHQARAKLRRALARPKRGSPG